MFRYLMFAAILAVPVLTGASQTDEGVARWKANTARHQYVVMRGVPAPYTAVSDKTADTKVKLFRGRDLFDRHCASCHGWSGQGGGPEGFYLVPAPADLEWLAHTPKDRADPYIYWAIAEGGKQFESDMPAFKYQLTREDRWALTAYLRAGMPYKNP